MTTNNNEIVANEIPLLSSHKVYGKISTPSFWEDYVVKYYTERGKFFQWDGIEFFYGPSDDFSRILSGIRGTRWAALYKSMAANLNDFNDQRYQKFVITPDGQIFVKSQGSSFFKTSVRAKAATLRYMSEYTPGDSFANPDWPKWHAVVEKMGEITFPTEWTKARKEWETKEKENGNWAQYYINLQRKSDVGRTKRKMEVCDKTTTVIQLLEQYLKSINDGTATQAQVGEIYRQMTALATINKRIKTSFPKK